MEAGNVFRRLENVGGGVLVMIRGGGGRRRRDSGGGGWRPVAGFFDTTGQAEVWFLGKEAQKLLGLDPNVAQSDFLKEQLCDVVLLLKIKSRIFRDAHSFTVDAVEILQDDGEIPFDRTHIRNEACLEQGLLKGAKRQLTYHDSLDNDKDIEVKIATNNTGKGKMYEDTHVEQITYDSSDDGKPISKSRRRNLQG
ncbi:hypothetical protein OROMI_029719 [Orobanche minor]